MAAEGVSQMKQKQLKRKGTKQKGKEGGREREDGAGSGADTINLRGAEQPYLPPAGRGRAPGEGHQA